MARPSDQSGHYSRNTAPQAHPFVRGTGARVYDESGREFIDCCAQTLNLNMGQCHPEIEDAVIRQVRALTFSSSRFSNLVTSELVDTLAALCPAPLSRVNLRSTSGSCANECAIKAARKKTGKRLVFSMLHSHHGQTAEMMRISGKHFANQYLGERGAVFLPPPPARAGDSGELTMDDLKELWEMQDKDVAALIVEPVMVDAGVLTLSPAYLARLREFCTAHGVALIFDEIQTGFGWLGAMHAMEAFAVTPDIVTFGKAIGAGYPLAATVFTPDYDVLEYGEHELTYGAHPLSCAASLKMIEILRRPEFMDEVRRKSRLIEAGLQALRQRFPFIADVRGLGFIWGLEIELDMNGGLAAKDLVRRILDNGVITRTSKVGANSNILQFKPPLVVSEDELSRAFAALDQSLAAL